MCVIFAYAMSGSALVGAFLSRKDLIVMKKPRKILLGIALLVTIVVSSGVVFAANHTVSSPPPEFNAVAGRYTTDCSVPAGGTPATNITTSDICTTSFQNEGATAVAQYGSDQHAAGLNDAITTFGLGKDFCFFEGQYAVKTQTCNHQFPPPINNCSGVFKGGLLSPVMATAELGGFATIYGFRSDAGGCGGVWGALHIDTNSTHTVSQVNIADQGGDAIDQAEGAIVTLPRSASLNEWTSTYMIDYVPGHTYLASATVDGQFVQATFTIPV